MNDTQKQIINDLLKSIKESSGDLDAQSKAIVNYQNFVSAIAVENSLSI